MHSTLELCVVGMKFPPDIRLLLDPDIWVGDTGASVHMTKHAVGLRALKNVAGSEDIMVGNGSNVGTTAIGELPGTKVDCHGNDGARMVMQDVHLVPSSQFNLFSLSAMQLKGWILGGNMNSTWITKGKAKLVFDIVIPTRKGAVYCMYFRRDRSDVAGAATDPKPVKLTVQEVTIDSGIVMKKRRGRRRKSMAMRSRAGVYSRARLARQGRRSRRM